MSATPHTADVAAGAGIGILSARAAYWLYPHLRRLTFGDKRGTRDGSCAPSASFFTYADGRSLGTALSVSF